jgi:hypothetical protein
MNIVMNDISNNSKIIFNDLEGSLKHLIGLEEIIRQRGGLSAIKSNPVLRIVLFWYEIKSYITVRLL